MKASRTACDTSQWTGCRPVESFTGNCGTHHRWVCQADL